MKASIQIKLVAFCIFLVLLATVGISAAYYVLTTRDKHHESQQRIQTAFDIILLDFADQLDTYTQKFDEFLKEDNRLGGSAYLYLQDENRLASIQAIAFHLTNVVNELKRFRRMVSVDRLLLYGEDKRLMVAYQHVDNQETIGGYVVSQTGQDTYLPMDDPTVQTTLLASQAIADAPLPAGIVTQYAGELPDTVAAGMSNDGGKLGIRIAVPMYYAEKKIGVLIGEVFYTQHILKRDASLSTTDINLFAGNQLSVGTLPDQTQLDSAVLNQAVFCQDIVQNTKKIALTSVTLGTQEYYQGQCAFRNVQGATVGAMTVSLSQDIEKQEITRILTAVLLIAGLVSGVAFVCALLFSRKTIHSIRNIVKVIGAAAEGDLRPTAIAVTRDEIGMVALKLNQMIAHLRAISGQVQHAASSVHGTADTILRQMETLIRHMEQQAAAVDNTTESVEKINHFIDVVARDTNALLVTAAQILSSLQQTHASIEGVTTSTGNLTEDLQRIVSSVEQVSRAMKQMTENTEQLVAIAQQTETEIRHIDHSFQEVSQNAQQTQQLAKETMQAAVHGQTSVDASLRGMTDLKTVVANTAQIIQKVNTWGERVSSILDIVDDITEQTSLLALNASIISAQAGAHGRGFAVVADEIKNLAMRTKSSTKEISTLIHELRMNTEDGVKNIAEGMTKADQGMQLANAVKDALATILDSATRSSTRATDTVRVIQQTEVSSQAISASMTRVAEMVADNMFTIQQQEHNMEQVAAAVENISGMAEQVNRASLEQKDAAEQIAKSMEYVTEKFNAISDQTDDLKHNSQQIVTAMHTIDATTEQILQNAMDISGETVKNLIEQSEMLQKIVKVFKVS